MTFVSSLLWKVPRRNGNKEEWKQGGMKTSRQGNTWLSSPEQLGAQRKIQIKTTPSNDDLRGHLYRLYRLVNCSSSPPT